MHQACNVPTTVELKAGQDVKTPSQGTAAPGYRQDSDQKGLSFELLAGGTSDVTGEGSKVMRHLRSVPKIKWNKSGPAYAKQHVDIYKYDNFTFVLCIYFLTQS